MEQYDVYVFCDECGEAHPTGIRVQRDGLPFHKRSVADLYSGQDVPSNLNMQDTRFHCPNTSRTFIQRDHGQVFLVANTE